MRVAPPNSDTVLGSKTAELRTFEGNASGPLQSTTLFNGKKTIEIEHNGLIYRLQSTKLGKLILTK